MNDANRTANDEAQIRHVIDDWAQALRVKDVQAVVAYYAAELRTFDIAPPLQSKGADAQRSGLAAWFRTWSSLIGYEIHDLSIEVGDDVAFSTSVNRLSGRRTNGEDTDVWMRATVGFRRTGGRWLVTHVHDSVPFYMDGSLRAAVDLKP
jgi:ketosteroid isomerase-like protein